MFLLVLSPFRLTDRFDGAGTDRIVTSRSGTFGFNLPSLSSEGCACLELFGPGDTDNLPDGLHPDGDGYETLGRRFAKAEFGAAGRLLPGRVSEGNL